MKRDTKNNTITFSNDQDFFDFAVVQEMVFERSEMGTLLQTWNFTHAYNQAIEEGTKLVISDPNSQVVKHRAVTYRAVTRPVENVCGPKYTGK